MCIYMWSFVTLLFAYNEISIKSGRQNFCLLTNLRAINNDGKQISWAFNSTFSKISCFPCLPQVDAVF